ncbi:crotonase/enoyl-CoA hydratase family protein [Epibacterium ulvae]|uniref:crotonase/enoyl-CoA hydratase family protein n=1 Tax=Epibacterium ulvae TaxID=1156985 RepID=UPI001BFC8684|nr:crotonase/enoyl-CoA hydratase family protein [Epibacterium ulvae]MBT8155850.1 crotonase/enoyl-CoA hydratase family protein [Epibacterium ulvae]
MPETLTIEIDARGVATVTLNRPEKHNAMSAQMIAELTQVAADLTDDQNVRVVVLAAAGKSFCAGADLGWMQAQVASDAATRHREARALAMMLLGWNTLPKPVIGAVQGNAFGGGVGLIAICDVAIGVEGAKLALTETRLGLIPATIGPYVIAKIGEARARQVILSARIFEAEEALSFNLLTRVVSRDSLTAEIEQEVTHCLACAPQAIAAAKKMIRELGVTVDETVILRTIDALTQCWESGEAEAGIAAFFNKAAPPWRR